MTSVRIDLVLCTRGRLRNFSLVWKRNKDVQRVNNIRIFIVVVE